MIVVAIVVRMMVIRMMVIMAMVIVTVRSCNHNGGGCSRLRQRQQGTTQKRGYVE